MDELRRHYTHRNKLSTERQMSPDPWNPSCHGHRNKEYGGHAECDIPLVVLNQQKLMFLKLMKFNYTHTFVCNDRCVCVCVYKNVDLDPHSTFFNMVLEIEPRAYTHQAHAVPVSSSPSPIRGLRHEQRPLLRPVVLCHSSV